MSTPADIYAAELQARATVKQLSAEAAALRKEAKTCELAVDAHGMRLQAKELSLAANAARALAKSHHIEAANCLERCAAEMTHRMPPRLPLLGNYENAGLREAAGDRRQQRQARQPQARNRHCRPYRAAGARDLDR